MKQVPCSFPDSSSKRQERRFAERQQGQATAEMVIASIFLLVPIFLLIPLVGKLIDFKMATIEASRYVAFERTITSNQSTVRGATFANLPDANLQNGTLMRFFSANGGTITAAQNNSTGSFAPRPLWVDQKLTPFMSSASDGSVTVTQASSPTYADQTVGKLLGFFSNLGIFGFSWNDKGYYTATVSASASLPAVIGLAGGQPLDTYFQAPLTFTASDSLLSDTGSATNPSYVHQQIKQTLLTSLLSFTSSINQYDFLLPDLGGLKLGHIVTNSSQELPCDRLAGSSGSSGCSGGGTTPPSNTVSQTAINQVITQMGNQGYTLASQTTSSNGDVTLTFTNSSGSTVPVTLTPGGGGGSSGTTTVSSSSQDVYQTGVTLYNSLTGQGWSGGPKPGKSDKKATSWNMTFTQNENGSTVTLTVQIVSNSSGGSTVTTKTS
ncbi:MAG: hypothetical protein ACYCS1_06660 [Gammaproteobacteria bacterium]